MKKKFSFVGAGKMAAAIVEGMIKSGTACAREIECVCGNDDTGKILSKNTGIDVADRMSALSENVVILACKPQQIGDVSKAMEDRAPALLISILAGTTIERLRHYFPKAGKIVRVMPNMPAVISKGISCFAPESALNSTERETIFGLLSAIGEVIECKESDLDAVTALSGSGPGYIFEFAAAMIEAGIKIGLSPEISKRLTIETFAGSGLLMSSQNSSPEELRNAVSSPGGTTLAALKVFEDRNLRKIIEEALVAAKKRSEELSKL